MCKILAGKFTKVLLYAQRETFLFQNAHNFWTKCRTEVSRISKRTFTMYCIGALTGAWGAFFTAFFWRLNNSSLNPESQVFNNDLFFFFWNWWRNLFWFCCFFNYLSLFVLNRTQVRSLHCLALSLSQSVLLLNFVQVGNPPPSVSAIEQPTDLKKI